MTSKAVPDSGITPEADKRLRRALRSTDGLPDALFDGLTVDGYRCIEFLGAGSSGQVYLAMPDASDAPVVLKIIPQAGEAPDSVVAARELAMLERIRSEYVPRLLAHGRRPGCLFIATEHIDGVPLDRADIPSDPRHRVRLLAAIATAVQSIHELGVIHRDLKPSNILLTPAQRPVIIDLGVATLVTAERSSLSTLTCHGAPIGSPAFMAPEQAGAASGQVTTRADIYALGSVGYWLLTGQPARDLSGTTPLEALARVSSSVRRHPRAMAPSLDTSLAAVLMKACDHDPARRYNSASEFASDLGRWLSGEPVQALTASRWQRAMRLLARRPLLTTTLVCALIAATTLLAVGATIMIGLRRPSHLTLRDEGRTATLVTPLGLPLASWRSASAAPPVLADMFPLPDGDRRVVVTLIMQDAVRPDRSARLCVWDPDNPSTPLWQAPASDDDPPLPLPGNRPKVSSYRADGACVADMIAENPGLEIAVTMSQAETPSLLRIYSIEGKLLDEVWHVGSISGPFWLESGKVLLLRGCDNLTKLSDRGFINPGYEHPEVVFAIKPTLGRSAGLINGPHADPLAAPLWYLYPAIEGVSPPLLSFEIRHPTLRSFTGEAAMLHMQFAENAVVSVCIGADGRPLSDIPRGASDGAVRLHGKDIADKIVLNPQPPSRPPP